MNLFYKFFFWITIIFTVVSLTATFYKTYVQEDFSTTGVWIELYEGSSYVWFLYENVEYEIEPEVTSYDELLLAVSDEIGVSADSLNSDFVDYYDFAYDEALVVLEDSE